jgi:hypothetical protein
MVDPEKMATQQYIKKEIDQYRSFLKPSLADNQDDFYGPIRPLIGPELSVADLDKEDILSYVLAVECIQEFFANGIDAIGMEEMTTMTAELKLSMSQQGRVLDNIFSNKIEYSQTQELHEYQHPPEKRGLLGRKTPPRGR